MVTRRTVLGTAGAAVAGSLLAAGPARADATITVNPGADFGAWEGWGTSLAWWANLFGNRDDFADIFFTTNSVTYNGTSLPGLGLTIARYNLGACSWNSVDGTTMVASPNIPRFKQIEGFWQDWRNTDPASSAWNWNADAKQRAALVKATARGAISELFANSPMWWMCNNHNPSGASGGGNNLQTWNYAQHAYHLAVVARHARDNWGVTFRTVEPFNEPSSSWWTATGTQEGCHVDASIQATILPQLRTALNNQGLSGTRISASDETSYDLARTTWGSFGSAARGVVDQVNVHGYQGSGGRRDLLYNDVHGAGKALWNSEFGNNESAGITMAKDLCLDWTWLHPTAWVYWQVMDPSAGWAAIQYNPDTATPGAVQPKYYVLAQFTRHIRPGMRILNTGNGSTAAAYDASAKRLVIVAVNETSSAQTYTFDLSAFGTVTGGTNGVVPRWTTVPSGSDRYTRRTDTYVSGKRISLSFPANSVQTLQVDGVSA